MQIQVPFIASELPRNPTHGSLAAALARWKVRQESQACDSVVTRLSVIFSAVKQAAVSAVSHLSGSEHQQCL